MPGAYAAIYLHLVWDTWDRAPLLTPEIERDVYRVIGAECVKCDVELIALGGTEDHVHLLVRLPPVLAPAELLKQVKGVSSHLINIQHALRTVFRWRGGYGAVSVSPRHLKQVAAYIARQKEHHTIGSVSTILERIEEHVLVAERYVHEGGLCGHQPLAPISIGGYRSRSCPYPLPHVRT
jgi:REP element-mobilizing transposase RayT